MIRFMDLIHKNQHTHLISMWIFFKCLMLLVPFLVRLGKQVSDLVPSELEETSFHDIDPSGSMMDYAWSSEFQ